MNNYSNKEIAAKLKISEKTVERWLNKLYDKTNTETKQELKELFKVGKDKVLF